MRNKYIKYTLYLFILSILTYIGAYYLKEFLNNDDFQKMKYADLANHYRGVDCTKLDGSMVRPNNDYPELKKDICIGQRAWFENDPQLCKLHSDPDHCYTWMAIKTNDLELCELKQDKDGYFYTENYLQEQEKQNAWLYDCYRSIANWNNDRSICDQIPFEGDAGIRDCKKAASGTNTVSEKYKDRSPI